jgi:uncharacterized membrane protein
MSRYELLLFFHIAFATIWLGAGFALTLLVLRGQRSGDPYELARLSGYAEWLTPRLFIPASLLTLLFGIGVVLDGPWNFGMLFVDLGLLGFAATFVLGVGYLEPTAKRLKEAVAEHGPTSPEAAHYGQRLALGTRLDMVLLFSVVSVMAAKPVKGDTWTLVGLGAAMAAAAAILAFLGRPKAAAVPAAPPAPVQ